MPLLVVMGVTGAGKTSVGRALAERLGVPFAEGDEFHSAANVAKMSVGTPLDDDDRWPWLRSIGLWLAGHAGGAVVSCSALKRRYRDVLRDAAPGVAFVRLAISRETALARVAARPGHFMPPALVDSQFDALEPLGADEGVTLSADVPVDEIVDGYLRRDRDG